jgi:hypothetical protein
MLGICGVFVELTTSRDMVSRFGRRLLCRAAMQMIIPMVAGLREERAVLALVPFRPFTFLQPLQQFLLLALSVLHLNRSFGTL